MARIGRRPALSAERKAELWGRWKNGQSFSEIRNALGKHAACIFGVVARRGGIARHTMREREEISRGLSAQERRFVKLRLQYRDRHRLLAERSRAMVVQRGYRAAEAESQAWDRSGRLDLCLPARHSKVQEVVALGWNSVGDSIHTRRVSIASRESMVVVDCPLDID